MIIRIIAVFLFAATSSFGQPNANNTAKTSAPCSPGVAGDKNSVVINCSIDPKQSVKMIALLNKVLASQLDADTVMAKLDEILRQSSQPKQEQNCTGGNCVMGPNFGSLTVNQPEPKEGSLSFQGPYKWRDLRQTCDILVDPKCSFYVVYENTGNASVTDIRGISFVTLVPKGESQPVFDAEHFRGQHPTSVDVGVSTSQNQNPLILFPSDVNAAKELLDSLARGDQHIYFYGGVNYQTSPDKRHWKNFCYLLEADLQTVHSCPDGNNEDLTPKE